MQVQAHESRSVPRSSHIKSDRLYWQFGRHWMLSAERLHIDRIMLVSSIAQLRGDLQGKFGVARPVYRMTSPRSRIRQCSP